MSTEPPIEKLYLRDLSILLKEKALQARSERDAASGHEREYALGRLMALHEVISLMQQQAEAFGIDVDELGLSDINPEKDLL